ncbi:MAG TPA: hypothetical protein IAB12_05215 [Candidatus Ornithospirochaeta avicola]|uniref:Uncharacterized protein n=1 Tax=Candidatus Ornithospirochaeta avicola TaxID=2840896 RepID=A0A9D1PU52_9SPIO|nr:hypothetical protein [Candidatus Ornithospirochaeta avicola]
MKKAFYTFIFLFLALLPSYSSIFSSYDVSIYSTQGNSVQVMDDERIGFDYTANAFLSDMTSGFYIRLGAMSTYSTLLNPFFGESQDMIENEYTLLFGSGPAVRRFVSTTLSWYMTFGLDVMLDKHTQSDAFSYLMRTRNLLSFDFDSGFRLSLTEHLTLRIGIASSYPVFALESTSYEKGKEDPPLFIQYLFLDDGEKSPLEISGYIILGHTYANWQEETRYRYIITENERKLEVMN